MGLKDIKNKVGYDRAKKKFHKLDSQYHNMKKLNRLSPGSVNPDELSKMSRELGNAAFEANEWDYKVTGDGDYASYDDVGPEGFDAVVQRQEFFNKAQKLFGQ